MPRQWAHVAFNGYFTLLLFSGKTLIVFAAVGNCCVEWGIKLYSPCDAECVVYNREAGAVIHG